MILACGYRLAAHSLSVSLVFRGGVLRFFIAALLLAASTSAATVSAQTGNDPLWQALSKLPPDVDASPVPDVSGDFVSIGAEGAWRQPPAARISLFSSASMVDTIREDCSPEAIIHYAKKAPGVFEANNNGTLYGVRTHTPETRLTTRYWDMPGFNSCALVVYAILKKAGCGWAKYTANARDIYDMAYKSGWRPSTEQRGGCMVAWNSKWEGNRPRIGVAQKQTKSGRTSFRHVGIATGSWLSVDNNSWLSRPTAFFTFRPISYESPIFLCPPEKELSKETNQTLVPQ